MTRQHPAHTCRFLAIHHLLHYQRHFSRPVKDSVGAVDARQYGHRTHDKRRDQDAGTRNPIERMAVGPTPLAALVRRSRAAAALIHCQGLECHLLSRHSLDGLCLRFQSQDPAVDFRNFQSLRRTVCHSQSGFDQEPTVASQLCVAIGRLDPFGRQTTGRSSHIPHHPDRVAPIIPRGNFRLLPFTDLRFDFHGNNPGMPPKARTA